MQVLQAARSLSRAAQSEPCHWSEGCNNDVGVTAGKASHNASNARGVTAGKMGRNSSHYNLLFKSETIQMRRCNYRYLFRCNQFAARRNTITIYCKVWKFDQLYCVCD